MLHRLEPAIPPAAIEAMPIRALILQPNIGLAQLRI
jgi:hypothetical protein